jgi:dCTP deaminase
MLLSDQDIRSEIASGRIGLTPFDFKDLQPSSIDVHLGIDFFLYKDVGTIDPKRDQADLMYKTRSRDSITLAPFGFALGSTVEHIALCDDIAARFEGKSSIGRLGLLTHVTAGFIDAGFDGYITLELHNVSHLPMVLYPGMKIGQLCFFKLSSKADIPYGSDTLGSHYQHQSGPTTSRIHLTYE